MSRLPSSSESSLVTALEELPKLSREQLIELWIAHMGRTPPKAASPSLLLRAVAYVIQEQQLGGLKGQELRTLLKLAQGIPGTARTRTTGVLKRYVAEGPGPAELGIQSDATAPARSSTSSKSAIGIALRPGTRLVREWQGKSHTVEVRDHGFGWNGEVYRSLSAVAQAITGARWSGNRFFRL